MRDGWKRIALGEVTQESSIRVGRLANEAVVLSSTKHHGLVRSDEYFKNRQIHSDDISDYKLVRKGWFAYATNHLTEGSIGLQGIVEIGCVSPIYTVFSCSPEIDTAFMYRILKSDVMLAEYGVHDQASVDRRGAVRYRDFKKIEVNLPPLAEQRRIAEILDEVDGQIRAQRAILHKREMVHAGVLDQLFMDGVIAGRRRVRSEIGEIPYDWDLLPVSEMCEVGSGSTPLRSEGDLYFSPSGTPWVKTLDLNDGVLSFTQESVTDTALQSSNMRIYPPQTVLVAMYGGWGQIGRTAILGCSAAVNQALSALEIKQGARVLPEFLLLALQHGRFRWRKVGASTRKDANVTKRDVEAFLIPVPGVAEQEQITRIVADLFQQRSEGDRLIAKLELFKKSTMDDLLMGKARVLVPA
ncbi:restriction endonuclease subunit S [Streptomyces sp. ISL-96]|uniref:restriction endonuclease subunit S n=1 Tax=Streptomyces sp. ISL-96 TaxID=2819191 RepID=UPI001BE71D70|nr:restriction endonuclease subunit S [Streptomyces sp. ISL-96]MBT2487820.1 restriction endonuclease subunit S [Streptomyces sp. ISL-96]